MDEKFFDKKLLTVKDLCQCYHVTRKVTERWRKEGMPYYRIGSRTIRFMESKVEKWLKDNGKNKRNPTTWTVNPDSLPAPPRRAELSLIIVALSGKSNNLKGGYNMTERKKFILDNN